MKETETSINEIDLSGSFFLKIGAIISKHKHKKYQIIKIKTSYTLIQEGDK